MNSFEIMFDDLTEEAQARFLEFQGLDSPEDGNWHRWPNTSLAIIDLEEV